MSATQFFESILDFSKPLDLVLFDRIVSSLMSPNVNDINVAQDVLTKFKNASESFFISDYIISQSQNLHSRFVGAQILEEGILRRWNTLSQEQKDSIKGFLISQIVAECSTWQRLRSSRMLLTKLNSALVAVAKREWPARWPTFVRDVCMCAQPTEPLVENNVHLLTMLGEDIFEFGEKGMTSRWAQRKKEALQGDFEMIYQLLEAVLSQAQDTMLLNAALQCFTKYVPWMPFEKLFGNGPLLDFLADTTQREVLRNEAIRCLTEISALPVMTGVVGDQQKQCMLKTFRTAAQHVINALPTHHSGVGQRIARAAELDEEGADVICQWITTYLKTYIRYTAHDDILLRATHEMIVGLTHVESKEIFKCCVEYWWWLGNSLLQGQLPSGTSFEASTSTSSDATGSGASRMAAGSSTPLTNAQGTVAQLKSKLHTILSDVRYALIKKMAKPEEIIIVEDEGEIRRETLADVENLQLYSLMREALIFFTHLDPRDTSTIMTMLMSRQLDRSEWSWRNCSTLCWAVGSISGAMTVEAEKDLFVSIMTDLLKLCREMVGKENRAVIASNIMYIVGQYPRFLRNHTSFLRTVSRKLFEFMLELFPGVQDMAVDTFLKLSKLCPDVFLESGSEPQPFILTILDTWPTFTASLNPSHIEALYCALGYMIASKGAIDERQGTCPADSNETSIQLLARLLQVPLWELGNAQQYAAENFDSMCGDAFILRKLLHFLRIFSNVASSVGPVFIHQMQNLLTGLQNFYCGFSTHLSGLFSAASAAGQDLNSVLYLPGVRQLRLCKKEVLKVIELFVENTTQDQYVASQVMPQIFDVVLTDYVRITPVARDAGVLALVTACVTKLKGLLSSDVIAIMDHTFTPTTSLILENTTDYPEHRVELFRLMNALCEHCFESFLTYIAEHEDVVASILWAIKHTERTVMQTGLELLQSLVTKIVQSELGERFYTAYMHRIMQDVMVCALDTLHTAGFPLQCSILQQLFRVSKTVAHTMPVIGSNAVLEYFQTSLREIPTLTPEQVQTFVDRCYTLCDSAMGFRQHMADFLIEVQIWGAEQENAMLLEEEKKTRLAAVPGLAKDESLAACKPTYERFTAQMEDFGVQASFGF